MRHVYFPQTAIISMSITMSDGMTAEAGMVGNRGMVGLPAVTGAFTSRRTAFVLVPGSVLRISADALKERRVTLHAFNELLLRYVQARYDELSQIIACTRLHSVEERLCRWLLMVRDRANLDDLPLTHELISEMLGVRREAVTIAAVKLQKAGLIHNTRGHITVLDRKRIEEDVACECYRVIRDELDHLLAA